MSSQAKEEPRYVAAEENDIQLGSKYGVVQGCVQPFDWEDNVHNWNQFIQALTIQEQRQNLLASLTRSQETALLLLEEWWNTNLEHDRAALQEYFRDPTPNNKPTFANLVYSRQILELWVWEFGICDIWVTGSAKKKLTDDVEIRRQHAAAIAAAHRTALATHEAVMASNYPNPTGPSQRNPFKPIPACTSPCPWLTETETQGQYPRYLWDRSEKRTVRFPTPAPDYIVVSHTWGRWHIAGQQRQVVGVPWDVPRVKSELFDVKQLPNILDTIGSQLSCRYVWLDLVCIPQDGSEEQDTEIDKQAGIFASAKWAVIWFNQVPSWDGLLAAVNWLGEFYFSTLQPQASCNPQQSVNITKAAQRTTRLVKKASSRQNESESLQFLKLDKSSQWWQFWKSHVEVDGWFSSLWTLQEICLRPDMILCDRKWRLLRIGEKMPFMQMDHLVALFNTCLDNFPKKLSVPRGVHELGGILTRTAMHKLLDMSAIDILVFGNQRYCKDANRAKAIMSALGVHQWYQQQLNSGVRHQDTSSYIESKYPLEFVREVQQKFGALFFGTVDLTRLPGTAYHFGTEGQITGTTLTSSMLPFGRDVRRQRFTLTDSVAIEDHTSVSSWMIHLDGSVRIQEACVVASSQKVEYIPVQANITAILAGQYVSTQAELHEWLKSFRPNSEKYAVCLFRKLELYSGVILERIYSGNDSEELDLLKIGTFWFSGNQSNGSFDFRAPGQHLAWRVM